MLIRLTFGATVILQIGITIKTIDHIDPDLDYLRQGFPRGFYGILPTNPSPLREAQPKRPMTTWS